MALDTPSSPFSFISTRSLSHENDHSIFSPPVEQIAAQLASWAEEFEGDYEIQIFGERVIVLTSVEDIRRVLALRPSKFVRNLSPVSLRHTLRLPLHSRCLRCRVLVGLVLYFCKGER